MNIHETYVSSGTAKLLKQAGFDWETRYYYNAVNNYALTDSQSYLNNNAQRSGDSYSAPTQAVAQRWLREEKKCDIFIYNWKADKYGIFLYFRNTQCVFDTDLNYLTYEAALEVGLRVCLTQILEKKK